jgi:serine/threonine protein kinase
VNKTFGRYEVIDVIGKGAMGLVYRCKDPQIGRIVAVKAMLMDPNATQSPEETKERMLIEAQAAGVLSHYNIVTIFDVGLQDDGVYIVMEYLEGQPLDNLIKNNTALTVNEVLNIIKQVGDALDYAHTKGIIHRDVKPANIMKTADGRCILMDFGIAFLAEISADEKGTLVGSPIYMSPEQLEGSDVTSQSDLYSLGAVVYELLTGYRPYRGKDFNQIVDEKYQNKRIPLSELNKNLPLRLEDFFDSALAADPAIRPGDGNSLLQLLKSSLYNTPANDDKMFTGSQNILIQTQQFLARSQQFQAQPKAPPKPARTDAHMAETMMMQKAQMDQMSVTLGETEGNEKPAVQAPVTPQPQWQQPTQHQHITPKTPAPPQSAATRGYGEPAPAKKEESEYKMSLPKLGSLKIGADEPAPAAKEEKIEEAKQHIIRKKSSVSFQRPEDLTVEGKRALIAELKTGLASLDANIEKPDYVLNVGTLYLRLSKHSEALAYFKRVIKMDWEIPESYVAMAQLFSDYGSEDKSSEYWAISDWLTKRKVGQLSLRDGYLLGKKFEKFSLIKAAITVWEEGAALQPWHLDTWKELSRYYLQMKDYKNALRTLEHTVELSKFDSTAWRNIAVCHQNMKHYSKALESWEKALRLEPHGEGGAKAKKQIMTLKKILRR